MANSDQNWVYCENCKIDIQQINCKCPNCNMIVSENKCGSDLDNE